MLLGKGDCYNYHIRFPKGKEIIMTLMRDDAKNVQDDTSPKIEVPGNTPEEVREAAEVRKKQLDEEILEIEAKRQGAFFTLGEQVYAAATDDKAVSERFQEVLGPIKELDSRKASLKRQIEVEDKKAEAKIADIEAARKAEEDRKKAADEAEEKEREAEEAKVKAAQLEREAESARRAREDAEKSAGLAASAAAKTRLFDTVDAAKTMVMPAIGEPAPEMSSAELRCPSCNAVVLPGDKFCMHCGTSLQPAAPAAASETPTCPSCGAPTHPEDKFCMNCGHKLEA